jgi:ankyrin repeat protein
MPSITSHTNDKRCTRFLLPTLQTRTILEATTIRDREEALKTLPSNLDEAFGGTMSRVKQQPTELFKKAAKTIAWIHLAERPLTVDELLCSLAIKDGDTSLDGRGIPIRKTLLNCCHGLAVVDQETSTVRLVHYSLQEYLSRQDQILGVTKAEWHMKIARTCLTFLKFPSATAGEAPEQNSSTITLLFYAATQWGHHLRRSDHSSDATMELAKEYLRTGLANDLESLRLLYEAMFSYKYKERLLDDVLPTHIVAFFGIPAIMSYLISTARNLDSKDPGYGRTPLSWAAGNGHEAVVKLLLATGKVDADWKDKDGRTPLWQAAEDGHEAVVKLLLATGKVDADSKDKYGRTPLSQAAENGHEAVVKLLLATGKVDADSKDKQGQTPLSQAAANGHEAVVKRLLATGKVDADSKDKDGRTPLWRAAENEHEAVVKLLLATGKVDADSKNKYGRTPL